MDINYVINRINELARKKKQTGLSTEETKEQTKWRNIYLNNVRSNFRQQLESIRYVEDEQDHFR